MWLSARWSGEKMRFRQLAQWKSAAPSHSALLGLAMAMRTIKL
jgi:hypothetical protein